MVLMIALSIPEWEFLLLSVLVCGYAAGALLPPVLSVIGIARGRAPDRPARVAGTLGFLLSLFASLAGCLLSLLILLTGQPLHLELPQTLPFGTMALHADGLSAFFLGVICLLAGVVSIYSIGYTTEFRGRRNMPLFLFLYNLFLLSMAGVVLAGHAVVFLIAWEGMSLATFFLISFEHEDPASRRAAFLYVVMTHIGTAFLAAMFVTLHAATGSFSFDAWDQAGQRLSSPAQSLVFLCAFVGFGIKAGVMPFHIWLPEAHPAAPSNVSALMSGVMIKTGIYGMVRVFFGFLGPAVPEWWGIFVLALAVASSVLGVLYALMEHDLKRLLAFHSIENIGIILMGVGGALFFTSLGNRSLAAIALTAGLFHVLNHAIFKGLLFLGAGSVLRTGHTKNIEELGGLIKRLPWTAFFFLIGAAAISALPPLNGFVSEWLTFQALLLGFHAPGLAVKIVVPLSVALLALTGALAAACFVKAFGISFLGLPRSQKAAQAVESPPSMLTPMGFLALLCVLFGIAPGLVLALLNPFVPSLTGGESAGQASMGTGLLLTPPGSASSVSPALLAASLLAVTVVPIALGALLGGKLRRRSAMTWACGLPKIEPRMQYSATGFSKPLRMIFRNIFRASHEIEISEETSPYFHPQIRFELKTESVFMKYLYEPLNALVLRAARPLRRLQTGRTQSYLLYIFVILVLLLLFAR